LFVLINTRKNNKKKEKKKLIHMEEGNESCHENEMTEGDGDEEQG
jgi:hypothetical protein